MADHRSPSREEQCDSSIEQLHHTTFRGLKHTRNTQYPAFYLDIGWSFDGASLAVFTGGGLGSCSSNWPGIGIPQGGDGTYYSSKVEIGETQVEVIIVEVFIRGFTFQVQFR